MLAKVLGALCAFTLAGAAEAAEPLRADVVPSAAPQEVQVLERRFAPGESSGWHIHHGIEMTWCDERRDAPQRRWPAAARPARRRQLQDRARHAA